MKILKHTLIVSFIALMLITTSCSKHKADTTYTSVEISPSDTVVIKSQKAYNRGIAEGRRIAAMNEGYDRQNAIFEMYALITALERNGFPQTASDFACGLQSVLNR